MHVWVFVCVRACACAFLCAGRHMGVCVRDCRVVCARVCVGWGAFAKMRTDVIVWELCLCRDKVLFNYVVTFFDGYCST